MVNSTCRGAQPDPFPSQHDRHIILHGLRLSDRRACLLFYMDRLNMDIYSVSSRLSCTKGEPQLKTWPAPANRLEPSALMEQETQPSFITGKVTQTLDIISTWRFVGVLFWITGTRKSPVIHVKHYLYATSFKANGFLQVYICQLLHPETY